MSQDPTSPEGFMAVADAASGSLPLEMRKLSDDIVIQIADYAEDDVLRSVGVDHRDGLLGLYHGVDVTQKSLLDTVPMQDHVFLYRLPILRFWQEGEDRLEDIIAHVLIHEIGHHFGLSDDDMHALEDEARAEEK